MSNDNPTQEEIEYLSDLSAVRSDGFDRTSPALARKILGMQKAIEGAMSALFSIAQNPQLSMSEIEEMAAEAHGELRAHVPAERKAL